MSDPGHSGLIVMRPFEGYHRGCLLMNISETESRIKFMPGYLLAAFFVDPRRRVVAEYVRWLSPAHLGAAFESPEFAEHLPIAEKMSPHPAVAFGSPDELVSASAEIGFSFADSTYGMTIVSCAPAAAASTRATLKQWCEDLIGHGLDAALIHTDDGNGRIALLLCGNVDEFPQPPIDTEGTRIVEHLGILALYTAVLPGADPALEFQYSMVPIF
jgi:hypothetical protein